MGKQYRQGDVFLEKIQKLPAGVNKRKAPENNKLVLAWGEATGHHHAITASPDVVESFVDSSGKVFLNVTEEVEVTHQEHSTIDLPAGIYTVTTQREYTPEAIIDVRD